jgi:hypothetical protein
MTGSDASQEAIKEALRSYGGEWINFEFGDILDITLPDASKI